MRCQRIRKARDGRCVGLVWYRPTLKRAGDSRCRRQRGCEMTVWIYVNTSKEVGDRDHLKVFDSQDAAETWFEENDPEGVAFEYAVLE